MDADQLAVLLADMWESLLPVAPGLRMVRKGGAYALINDQPSPINGVYFERPDPDPAVVSALLNEVAATGLPYFLHPRPSPRGTFAQLAIDRGMSRGEDLPLMLVESTAAGPSRPAAGLAIRELAPAESSEHMAVAATGFGVPVAGMEQLGNPALLGFPGVHCYLGELDGEPVTTALSVRIGGTTGLFKIVTVPGQQGRGFGAAITAHAISEAAAAGSPWCWLQSSPGGIRIYQNLGFTTVETWEGWKSPRLE